MNDVREITELLGDGIAEELKKSLHSVAEALPESYRFDTVDLSHENRKKGARQLYNQAVESMKRTGIGIKYPTATVEESPNAVLRKLLKFSVIHRPVTTIPGIKTNFTGKIDLDIVRIATGGTYDDPGQMIGDYAAASLRVVDRKTCEQAAHYAFSIAMRERKTLTSSSKYTIQRVTDGLFEDIVDEVADEPRYRDIIEHRRELFDALLAKLAMDPEQFQASSSSTNTGIFCPTWRAASSGVSAWAPRCLYPSTKKARRWSPCSMQVTAPPPISPDRTRPTQPPSFWPSPCF